MSQPKIFCIIVTYNGARWVEKCFGSLINSTVSVNIIAIDNNSSDNTLRLIKDLFPSVTIIKLTSNLGFGQANNIGFSLALKENADYVFLLNQDAWIKENTVEELLKAVSIYPDFGIISPFHLDATENNYERLFLELFDRYNPSLVTDLFFDRLKPIYETSYIHAASWLISRECILTTGGFDPVYFHYGEDDDYLQRAKHFRFKVGLVPSAFIIHDAVYNSWDKLEWNENRNMVIALQQLKKMSPHFRSNVLVFLKSGFDELTTLLIFRKFKKFKFRFNILLRAILSIRKIHKSYRTSFNKGAFLSNNG